MMRVRFYFFPLPAWLFVGLLTLLAGCQDQNARPVARVMPSVPSPPEEPPADNRFVPADALELTKPKVEFGNSQTIIFQSHYHFTKGAPAPEHWYRCRVVIEGNETEPGFKQFQGKDLKAEGEIADAFLIPRPKSKKYTMQMLEAQQKNGPYKPISNALSGEASVRPPPKPKKRERDQDRDRDS
jgi:hypothetical protein